MPTGPAARVLGSFALVVALVFTLSAAVGTLRGESPERAPAVDALEWRDEWTVAELARANDLPGPVLREALDLSSPADRDRELGTLPLSRAEAEGRIRRAAVLAAEHASKDWRKILAKFALWFVILGVAFHLLRRGRITRRVRLALLGGATLLFGVVLGPDPNPMGTVKDAVVLLGRDGAVFPPRLVAFGVFLALVVFANKFICTWGCQFGALQDLVFRLNRDRGDRTGLVRQFRPPFALTNAVRCGTFALLVWGAFGWSADLLGPVDPFRVFRPATLGTLGLATAGALLLLSLFVYRPWCHLFCPFGLVGWVAERLSRHRIRVDHEACVACGACARACPSTAMGTILGGGRVVPDCFACGTCLSVCRTGAVRFGAGRRRRPPPGAFAGRDPRKLRARS